MNQHNISNTADLPVKRKRGRPRKDESVPRKIKQHTQPPPVMAAPPPAAIITTIQPLPPPTPIIPTSNINVNNKVDPNMVGQAVTCVIDGIFDNGYLLSTRLGPNDSILRGIVFQQGHVSPVTPANDVAPHVEMTTRGEFPILPSNPRNPTQVCTPHSVGTKQPVGMENYQTTPQMVTGGSSTSAPQESLRLVEQDDVMQVFEVSKTVEEQQDCDQRAKNENHVVSNPTAECFPQTDTLIIQKTMDQEQVVNNVKEDDGENPELITPLETNVENQQSMVNDELHQEIQEQTGEVRNIDANQDPSQEVGADLSLSNFAET